MDLLLLIKSLSILTFILLLIYLCFSLLKKRLNGQLVSTHRIKIIEQKRLHEKCIISIVIIDKIEFLLVTGPNTAVVKKISTSIDRKME